MSDGTGVVKGKALLVIERLDSKLVPFEVAVFIQSCSLPNKEEAVFSDDFGLLNTDTLPNPDAAYKLKVGGRVWVSVVYEFEYTRDYWGEYDVDLHYHRQRVLKRQPPRKPRYVSRESGREGPR